MIPGCVASLVLVLALALAGLSAPAAWAQGTVTAVQGDEVTLSVGRDDGVKVSATGALQRTERIGGEDSVQRVALFEVLAVEARRCRARLTKRAEGQEIAPGLAAVFDRALEPPPREPPAASPAPPPPSAKDPATLSREADAAYDAGNWALARDRYRALLAQVPGDVIAKRRLAEVEQRLAEQDRAVTAEAERRTAAQKKQRELEKIGAEFLMQRGDQAAAAGNTELALQYWRQVAAVDPAFRQAGEKIAKVEAAREAARVRAEEERKRAEEERVARRLREIDADGCIERGAAALVASNWDAAVEEFRKVAEVDPSYRIAGEKLAEARIEAALAQAEAAAARLDAAAVRAVLDDLSRKSLSAWQRQRARSLVGAAMGMVRIPAGTFRMGNDSGDSEERPAHPVRFRAPFWIDQHEVTVEEYRRVMGKVPAGQADVRHPVVNVTWLDAQEYCHKLGGRLPTEAEWEYAARGGLEGKRYPWGDEPVCTEDRCRANKNGSRDGFEGTAPVCSFPRNGYGLCDMAGNVWEWVADWNGPYSAEEQVDPRGPLTGTHRVLRGGSWNHISSSLFVASRYYFFSPEYWNRTIGFRCARGAE